MAEESKENTDKKKIDRVVRILSRDIEGKMKLYAGLTKIKGVSWALSNAACRKLGFNKTKLIGELSDVEIKKIEKFLRNPEVPSHMVNRPKDFETGENKHLVGSDLELRKEFDIKRLKKVKSYRGLRHTVKLPVRGQRTKGNFRPNKMKGGGIRKKK